MKPDEEAKIERFADRLDRKLRAAEAAEATRIATSSKVRVFLAACGFERQGKRNMATVTWWWRVSEDAPRLEAELIRRWGPPWNRAGRASP